MIRPLQLPSLLSVQSELSKSSHPKSGKYNKLLQTMRLSLNLREVAFVTYHKIHQAREVVPQEL